MRRRTFLGTLTGAAAWALRRGYARPRSDSVSMPTSDAPALAAQALDAARRAGATYADVRINRYRNERIETREATLLGVSTWESFGFGIRVIAGGAWGFCAATRVTPEAMAAAAQDAVAMARANAALRTEPVRLAPVAPQRGQWETPVRVDPFGVPVTEKVDLLLGVNHAALGVKGVSFCASSLHSVIEEKFFASTEGSELTQRVTRVHPEFRATAVSGDGTDFQSRAGYCEPMGRGYEYLREYPLLEDARQAGEDAVAKLRAPGIEPGRRDLVLMPSHLWLVIHESVAHATELDRCLGFEANFAGTSFVRLEDLGKLQYASPVVSIVGDRIQPNGLATVGYDDEGVPAMQFDIIRNGRFVGFQTTREQAAWVGDAASHACAYADSYDHMPMQRMPNVSLQPAPEHRTPDDLIGGIDDGVLIKGDGSWSIDMQRRNFQFGGQMCYRIHHGKIDGIYRDAVFQAMTLDFWNACDAVCSREFYELGGSFYCGKAQPEQVAPVSHGAVPARFRNINFLNTGRTV